MSELDYSLIALGFGLFVTFRYFGVCVFSFQSLSR